MPELKALLENTDLIVIERGKITINAQCYLERISAQNPQFSDLITKGREMQAESNLALAQMYLFTSEQWVNQEIQLPVSEKGDGENEDSFERLPTGKEVTARTKKISKLLEELNKTIDEIAAKIFRNKCERIELLVESWDITIEGQPVEIKADSLVEKFKDLPALVDLILSKVEAGVFGPLVTRPDTMR